MVGESEFLRESYRQRSIESFDAMLDLILKGEVQMEDARDVLSRAAEEPELATEILRPVLESEHAHAA